MTEGTLAHRPHEGQDPQAREADGAARPLRVVHLGPDPATGGGMPAVLRDLVSSPLAEHHRLEIIPTYRGPQPVRRLAVFALALARLALWCLGPGPRLVHVHTAVRGSLYRKALVVALAKALRRPVILHVHAGAGDIEAFDARTGPLARAAFRRAFALADRVLSVSAAGARQLEQRLGAGPILVVPNAAPRVDVPTEGADRADGEGAKVVYVGGFADPAKGGRELVAALPRLLERRPGVRVTLAGPGELPPAARGLVDGAVRWAGWVDGPAKDELFARCDVFVVPSVSEGLPVALLEAMAHGRAIVATRVGGIPEVLADGRDALLVPPAAPERLADAVAELAADPERRRRLGEAARARARRLTHEEVYGRLDALYRELGAA